jgi:tRNA dimethylallyltransferase
MVEEVENLHKNGLSWERLDFFGLEYRYVSFYLQKKITYNELFETLFNRICQFSKRQMTWLRKFEREGYKIQWIPEADFKIAKKIVSLNNIYN